MIKKVCGRHFAVAINENLFDNDDGLVEIARKWVYLVKKFTTQKET